MADDGGAPSPLWELAGMRRTGDSSGNSHVMTTNDWLRDPDGNVTASAVAIVADAALGEAFAHELGMEERTATVRLGLDLTGGDPGSGSIGARCTGTYRRGQADALSFGAVDDLEGRVLALATARSVRLPGVQAGFAPISTWSSPLAPPHTGPIDVALGLSRDSASEIGGSTTTWLSSPWFGNRAGNVQGGLCAVVGAVLMRRALDKTRESPRLLHLDVGYMRPLPSDRTPLGANIEVVTRGRKYVRPSATLLDGQGRPAVLVHATFALVDDI